MTLEEELAELYELKRYIETRTFQENIIKPIKEEIGKLKDAYDCTSLRELSEVKGKKWGLNKILKVLRYIDTDIRNKKSELD